MMTEKEIIKIVTRCGILIIILILFYSFIELNNDIQENKFCDNVNPCYNGENINAIELKLIPNCYATTHNLEDGFIKCCDHIPNKNHEFIEVCEVYSYDD